MLHTAASINLYFIQVGWKLGHCNKISFSQSLMTRSIQRMCSENFQFVEELCRMKFMKFFRNKCNIFYISTHPRTRSAPSPFLSRNTNKRWKILHAMAPYDTLTVILPNYPNDVVNRVPCMISQQPRYLVHIIL